MSKLKLTILTLLILALGIVAFSYLTLRQAQGDKNQNTNVIPVGTGIQETATTTEIDTADWKTYRNEEYGFEFKYPGEWVLNEIENGISVKYSKDWQFGMKQGFSPFSVIITNKSLEGFIKSYEDDFLDGVPLTRIISQEGYILDRQSGTKLIGNNAAGINTYYIFVIYNQKKYLISFNENEEVQRTMLSSFHFLK